MIDTLPRAKNKAIRREVEARLEQYRIYKYLGFQAREASITASYEPHEGGRTNKVSDQTGNIATHNVDEPERRRAFCEAIDRVVERLPKQEQFLIQERYLARESQYITDYSIYQMVFDPPISEGKYARIRDRAMQKIAYQLGLIDENGDVPSSDWPHRNRARRGRAASDATDK
ncbi:ArpU family phage packaging/lysis transcriptional regulator [Cohnella fermenti]|uniref:Transcriptional regulator n=1 Tax=Cohnella fermenti TaxID=2565925 RepID=A0A4S4C8N8_9BACL|nr:ArpU family phage packaging/lysis transcriptional regulator [Cohnella fermenti]THF83720.1 transcriptional regulator [Cohnella fermenti]